MKTMGNSEPWYVGQPSSRESERFRWPVYNGSSSWPWLALFETEADAKKCAQRITDYPGLVEHSIALAKQVAELEARIAELDPPSAETEAPEPTI